MGAAKARGTFEARKAQAIAAGTPAAERQHYHDVAEQDRQRQMQALGDDAAARHLLRLFNRPTRKAAPRTIVTLREGRLGAKKI